MNDLIDRLQRAGQTLDRHIASGRQPPAPNGRSRSPHASRTLLFACAALVAVAALVVTVTRSSPRHNVETASPATSTRSPSRGAADRCPESLPPDWASAANSAPLPLAAGASALPFAVSPDGTHIYAALDDGGWSGVAAIDRHGAVTKIHRFAGPQHQVVGGDASDSAVAWAEASSYATGAPVTYFLWDERSDVVRMLAHPTPSDGSGVSAPQTAPVIRDDHLTWVDHLDRAHNAVHLYDLTTHTDHVVATGLANVSTLTGPWLVWVGPSASGGEQGLHFADASTGQPIATPPALLGVTGVSSLAGDDRTLSWASNQTMTVSTWTQGEPTPRVLARITAATYPTALHASAHLVTWSDTTESFVANANTRGVATLTTSASITLLGTATIVTTTADDEGKSGSPIVSLRMIDVANLDPLPPCTP